MKLLCKKTPNNINMIPGKYYVGSNSKIGKVVEDDNGYSHYFTNNKYITDYYFAEHFLYIWDYFYTPQQTRKIKLQKLNEITL